MKKSAISTTLKRGALNIFLIKLCLKFIFLLSSATTLILNSIFPSVLEYFASIIIKYNTSSNKKSKTKVAPPRAGLISVKSKGNISAQKTTNRIIKSIQKAPNLCNTDAYSIYPTKTGLLLNSFGKGNGLNGIPSVAFFISSTNFFVVVSPCFLVSLTLTFIFFAFSSFSPTTIMNGTQLVSASAIFFPTCNALSSKSALIAAEINSSVIFSAYLKYCSETGITLACAGESHKGSEGTLPAFCSKAAFSNKAYITLSIAPEGEQCNIKGCLSLPSLSVNLMSYLSPFSISIWSVLKADALSRLSTKLNSYFNIK